MATATIKGKWSRVARNREIGYECCKCSVCGAIAAMDEGIRLPECPYCKGKMKNVPLEPEYQNIK